MSAHPPLAGVQTRKFMYIYFTGRHTDGENLYNKKIQKPVGTTAPDRPKTRKKGLVINMQSNKATVLNTNEKIIAKASLINKSEVDAIFKLSDDSHFDELIIGNPVYINFYDTIKGLEIYSGVIARVKEDKLYINKLKLDENLRKRMDIKVPINQEVYVLQKNEEKKSYYKFFVHLKDMSAGGIGFMSKLDLPKNEIYELVFDNNRETDVLSFQIIHKSRKGGENFLYGCAFYNLAPYQEKVIREYVFQKQITSYGNF